MTISSIEKEFEEKYGKSFEIKSEPHNYIHHGVDPSFHLSDIKSFYRQKINELVDEIIKLSDNIEAKYDTPEMEEWKAFKRFRNTLRDNFKK